MGAMPGKRFGAERAAIAPLTRAPVELAGLLRRARAQGHEFVSVWGFAVHSATTGRADGEAWAEAFRDTIDHWRAAYEGEGPASAAGILADDAPIMEPPPVEPVDERVCVLCGGSMEGRSKQARYCSPEHERQAVRERQRDKRKAAQGTRAAVANSHGPRESSRERVAA